MRRLSVSQVSRQRGGVVGAIIGLILIVGAMAAGAAYWAWREATRPGPLAAETVVLLRPGMSVQKIAATLDEAGALREPKLFVAVARVHGVAGDLKAGEYALPAGVSIVDLLRLLVEGRSILYPFTAAEGLTTAQILRLIAANPVLEGEVTLAPAEGTLLPETYKFSRGQTRDGMIEQMMEAQRAVLDALWDDRATELPISTREEAIILASIIEKETAIASERDLIAGVFINRLRRGMRLETDPTVIYGLTGGEPLGRGLRLSELRKETPYNTYIIKGLPPTPIANPGRAAIAAALRPAETDAIFFVADGTGGHAFAATLAEHNRNVARWRRIERENG